MEVDVHFYAAARELAGCRNAILEVEPPGLSQEELRALVAERFPALAALLGRMRLAVNGEFVDSSVSVRDGDRVDVLPPVAGGSPVLLCEISTEPISVAEVLDAVTHAGAGGVCVFHGIVRDHADGKPVARLDYEAHEALALEEMSRVLHGVVGEHPGTRIAAVHRVGRLHIGDVAVCVAASAAHREDAFAACRKAIDRIKETVPIWKKEWAPDGEAHWVNLEG